MEAVSSVRYNQKWDKQVLIEYCTNSYRKFNEVIRTFSSIIILFKKNVNAYTVKNQFWNTYTLLVKSFSTLRFFFLFILIPINVLY